MQRYCHEVNGEAWSLACGQDEILYLQHELDFCLEPDETGLNPSPFALSPTGAEAAGGGEPQPGTSSSSAQAGFDFTTAQRTPSFSGFGSSNQGKYIS